MGDARPRFRNLFAHAIFPLAPTGTFDPSDSVTVLPHRETP